MGKMWISISFFSRSKNKSFLKSCLVFESFAWNMIILCCTVHDIPHLSKRPSDLKQNGTQEKTPFSSTVFHIPSHGVIRFDASFSSKNHLLAG